MNRYKRDMFNDTMSRALNKRFGFPEDYTGRIEGFEDTVPRACKIFGSTKVEEITKEV